MKFGTWAENLTLMSSLICREVMGNGIGIDVKQATEKRERLQSRLDKTYRRLRKHGYKPGVGSSKKLQTILAEIEASTGIRFNRNRSGQIKTGANSLEQHIDCHPFIPLLLRANRLHSLLTNYLNKMKRRRLHPQYNYLLQTGRVSNGGDLATQTIPATGGIRECIVPERGKVFVQVDVRMMELVMLAQALKSQFGYDSKLADMINQGGDVHRKVAALIFSKNESDVTVSERNSAKVLNFGIPGGLGIKSLQQQALENFGLEWNESTANAIVGQWYALFPEVREFLENRPNDANGVITLTGRCRGGTRASQNRNTIFQGLGADAMTLGVWNLLKAGHKVVNLVHDEVLIEVEQEDDYREVVAEIKRLLIAGIKTLVPDIHVEVESAVLTCWSKKAKRVFDEQGRLVAWEPEL